jgi:fructose-bisphosphate aldolase class II
MTAGVREVLFNNPAVFDPREYLKVGRQNVKDVVAHKIVNVLGSNGKA